MLKVEDQVTVVCHWTSKIQVTLVGSCETGFEEHNVKYADSHWEGSNARAC